MLTIITVLFVALAVWAVACCVAAFAMCERDPPVVVERITSVDTTNGKPVYSVESGNKNS